MGFYEGEYQMRSNLSGRVGRDGWRGRAECLEKVRIPDERQGVCIVTGSESCKRVRCER